MGFKDFHFASPMWLLGLMLIPLGWGWYKYCSKTATANLKGLNKFIDQKLLPHLIIKHANSSKQKNYGWAYALLTFCIIMALANPRWNFDDIDAYQNTSSIVILLDLSASMNATDIAPSRIVRARQNIEDLINLSKGLKIGLVGFAGNAHLISPITDDIQTIRTYIPALDTDLTNLQGNSLIDALKMGAELLANEPGDKKSILLISDGNYPNKDFSKQLQQLQAHKIQVHVMGIGTTSGAPYRNNNGALHKSQGKTVIAKLNTKVLQAIAKQGHGVYTEAIYNDVGVKAILRNVQQTDAGDKVIAGTVRQWQDKYYWFIFPAVALALYLWRQKVLYLSFAIISASLFYAPNVIAIETSQYFQNSSQKAEKEYIKANFKTAAQLFEDPYNKGVALYRAGEYPAAEQAFKAAQHGKNSLAATYNAGNALMQQKKWRQAIQSYEAVLQQQPDHVAALHNLQIAKTMLEQNQDQDKEEEQQEKEQDQEQEQKQSKEQQEQGQQEQKQQQQKRQQDESRQSNVDEKQQSKESQEKQQSTVAQDQSNKEPKDDKLLNVQGGEIGNADGERAEQWLNRIDSDIKVFLKNKFYIEDVISAQ